MPGPLIPNCPLHFPVACPPSPSPLTLSRRSLLVSTVLASAILPTGLRNAYALPAKTLVFPRDRGAHPDFRTEWWYITGHARTRSKPDRDFGFQLTFFRSRIASTQAMTSRFAAKQLLFAHAAITDVAGNQLHHDQRIARSGFEVASGSESDMALKLRDWSLSANGAQYTAYLPAANFSLSLQFTETQAVLLQGNNGLSRKGPDDKQASYYYSQPQLAASGTLQVKGQPFEVVGTAWLDHEWSQELLHPSAIGWDWIGMNLLDGSALTAFRLRDKDGGAVWEGGSFRSATGALQVFGREDVTFQPIRFWKSPFSQTTYPVEWQVRTPTHTYTVKAVLDNQELDSRQSTGSIYWEGLSDLIDNTGKTVGRGYLEMTGYAAPLRL